MPQALWFDPSLMLIADTWRTPQDTLPLLTPSDGSKLAEIAAGQPADIEAAVCAAHAARNGPWRRMSATERGRILCDIGRAGVERVDALAEIEAHDVGKPLSQARADAIALARYMEFYGGAADKVMGEFINYIDCY